VHHTHHFSASYGALLVGARCAPYNGLLVDATQLEAGPGRLGEKIDNYKIPFYFNILRKFIKAVALTRKSNYYAPTG
jgi:hypothetical protein